MSDTGDGDLSEKRICHECVGEKYLSSEIEQAGEVDICGYCGRMAPSTSVDDLAVRVEQAFEDHYVRTLDHPSSWQERMQADRESNYDWEREGVPVLDAIAEAAQIPDGAAEDVLTILEERNSDFDKDVMGEESDFSSDSYYAERGPDSREWQEEWLRFVSSIKTQARFFSRSAASHLAEVFGDIHKLTTLRHRSVVVDAGPKTRLDHLYRARVFQTDRALVEALRMPDRNLGSPPHSMARAGRMNAQGISVFYGATNASVAIAEVRAPAGSRVVVAKFRITRPLRLLDLTALTGVHVMGSVFDALFKRQLERAAFLRTLGVWMARPVMPDDEAIDYLPTQAVADFLATMNEPSLDGIVFPSAQTKSGRNVVLFHEAAKVAVSTPSTDVEATVSLGQWGEEGWEVDYWVLEEIPQQQASVRSNPDEEIVPALSGHFDDSPPWDNDFRETTLEIECDSIEVHCVNSVKVNTTSSPVRRSCIEKRNPKY